MRALNPFTGEFYLETLHVARYTREMYCLFGGRHTHPSTIMPGRLQRRHHASDVHRLLRAADALLRLRQAQRADARRPVRLLPPGAAGLRHGRLPRDEPRQLGLVRRPRLRRLRLPQHDRVGPQALHHPRRGDRRRADLDRPRRDQPDDPDPARLVVLRLAGRTSRRSSTQRSARQPGRQEPPVEQGHAPASRRSATSPTSTRGSCRRGSTTSAPTRTSAATPAAARSPVSGARPRPGSSTSATPRRPVTRSRWCCRARRTCPRWSSSGTCRRSPTRSSATAPAPTTRPTAR